MKNNRDSHIFRMLSLVSASLIIMLGITIVVSWYTKNVTLLQILPNAVAMQYNIALGFILIGIGVLTCLWYVKTGKRGKNSLAKENKVTYELELKLKERTLQLEEALNQIELNQELTREEELNTKNQELQFKNLFDNMPGLFWRVEHAPEWPVKFFSRGAKELTGFSAEEFMEGKVKWIDRTHPDDLERLIQVISEGVEKKETFDITYRFLNAQNEVKWVREIGIYNDLGKDKVSLLDGFVFDVTDQFKAEHRVRESESLFKSLVGNMPGVVYRCGLEDPWEMYFLSDEIENLTGYPKSDFMGINPARTLQDMTPDDDKLKAEKTTQEAIANKTTYINEFRIINKDNSIRYIYEQGQAFYKDDGSPDFLVGTMFDITERIQGEDEIKKLSLVVEQSPISVIITDVDGNIEYVNPQFCDTTGYTAEEVIGKNPRLLKSGHHSSAFYKDMWETIRSGEIWKDEVRNKKKSGAFYWEMASIKPLKNSKGEITGFVGLKEDISESREVQEKVKANEQQMRSLNNALKSEQQRFSSMVSNVPGAIYRVYDDSAWPIIYMSDEIENITGYPASDFMESKIVTFSTIMHPDDVIPIGKEIQDQFNKGENFQVDYRVISKSGDIVWVRSQGQSVKGDKDEAWIDGVLIDITQRKEMEEQISSERNQLQKYLDYSPIAVAITKDGEAKYVNEKFHSIFGFEVGDSVQNAYVDGQDRDLLFGLLEKEKALTNHQMKYFDKNRKVIDTLLNTNHIAFNGEASLLSWVVDVTDLKRIEKELKEANEEAATTNEELAQEVEIRRETEEELRRAKEKMELAIEAAKVGIWDWDIVNDNLQWDDTLMGIYGINKKDFSGAYDAWKKGVHPEDRTAADEAIQAALKGESKFDIEFRIVWPDGEIRFIRGTGLVHRDINGEPERMLGVNWDITESKLAEQAIQNAKEKMELAIEAAKVGIWDWDVKNNINSWDDTLFKIYGISGDNFKNAHESWLALVHPDDLERVNAETEAALKGERKWNTEYRIIRPDGHIRFIRSIGDTQWDNKGNPIHMMGVNWDITDSKLAEQELAKAKEDADQANQSKSSFLANMSHEIRTPMNAVLGFSELLEKIVTTDIEKSYVSSIKSSGKSLLRLINEILDLSKIEAGKIAIDYNYFNLYDLLEEMQHIFSLKVQEKGLELIIDINKNTPQYINSDEVRIRQILINLINNAVKFTEVGFIKVTVDIENYSHDENEDLLVNLRIEVEDTGIGISKGFKNNLFRSFTQQDAKTTKKFGGTGLGLAISKKLAELLNGDILVESEEGAGSTFTLVLNKVETSGKGRNEETDQLVNEDEVVFEPATILIVDDITNNRAYVKGSLIRYNFELMEAVDGIEALKILETTKIDLILTDLRMPQMDGFELINEIKKNKSISNIPIIATSASVMEFNIEKARSQHFDDFLPKPVKVNDLVYCLTKYLPSNINDLKTLEFEKVLQEEIVLKIGTKHDLIKQLDTLKIENEKVKEHQAMDNIKEFNFKVLNVGRDFELNALIEYSESIQKALDSFDVEKMMSLINRFNEFINEVEKSIKE